MLCDKCNKNIASHLFTQNINGKIYKYYLCNECAKKLTNINFFLDDLLGNLISSSNNISNLETKYEKCPKCGATFNDIINSGKVGCGFCYNKFREMLLPSIKKLHTNTKHIGNIPTSATLSSSAKIAMLKSKLEIAIKNQEFELAAKLRDQINDLKKVGDNNDEQQQ